MGRDRKKTIDRHETSHIKGNRTETVGQNEKVTVQQGNRDVILQKGNDTHHLKMGNRDVILDMGNDTLTIKMGNQTTKLNLGKSETEALAVDRAKSGTELDQGGPDGRDHQGDDGEDRGPNSDRGEGPDDTGQRQCDADVQGRDHDD